MDKSPITFADSGLKVEATFEEKLEVFKVGQTEIVSYDL